MSVPLHGILSSCSSLLRIPFVLYSLSCAGWFCGAVPSVSNFTGLQVLQPGSSEWQQLAIPSGIKALVLVNLQSYGGGRNIWGESESKRRSWRTPDVADGLIEVRGDVSRQGCTLALC
jgi:diacylglycerol kinase (ATP)